MAEADATMVKQILDIAEREGKRTDILAARRMISGRVLQWRKGLRRLRA